MVEVKPFHVDPDLCTECGDCIKALPQAFRKVDGEELAEVYNVNIDGALLTKLQQIMTDCPGHAILWTEG